MDNLILAILTQQHKLKASSLYQTFKGKRTSSILCWSYFYDCLPFLGAFPELSEKGFQQILAEAATAEKITFIENELMGWQPAAQELPKVDYFRYGRSGSDAWRSVQFLVQAVSQLDRNSRYVPLENAPRFTRPVKQLIQRERAVIKETLFDELWLFFSLLTKKQADLLAGSLSGYQLWGASFQQLIADQEAPWLQLRRDEAIHQFLKIVNQHQDSLLYRFLRPLLQQNLNQSMLLTRRLFREGYSKAEIMKMRSLKEGTVNDHLIEWAILDEQFDFSGYVSRELTETLASLNPDYRSLRYQEAAEAMPELPFESYRLYQIQQRRAAHVYTIERTFRLR